MWIRHGCVGLVCTVARQLDNIDVLCYMLPKLEMYIKQPIIQIREEVHTYIHTYIRTRKLYGGLFWGIFEISKSELLKIHFLNSLVILMWINKFE